MADSHGTPHLGEKIKEKVAEAVSEHATEHAKEGTHKILLPFLLDLLVATGSHLVVRHFTGGHEHPEDKAKTEEALKLYQEGKKEEAMEVIEGHFLKHGLSDEIILGLDAARAVRAGLISQDQALGVFRYLRHQPHHISERFRKAHEKIADHDVRTAQFAWIAGMTDTERDDYIHGGGLADISGFERNMRKLGRAVNTQLRTFIRTCNNVRAQIDATRPGRGFWTRYRRGLNPFRLIG